MVLGLVVRQGICAVGLRASTKMFRIAEETHRWWWRDQGRWCEEEPEGHEEGMPCSSSTDALQQAD